MLEARSCYVPVAAEEPAGCCPAVEVCLSSGLPHGLTVAFTWLTFRFLSLLELSLSTSTMSHWANNQINHSEQAGSARRYNYTLSSQSRELSSPEMTSWDAGVILGSDGERAEWSHDNVTGDV